MQEILPLAGIVVVLVLIAVLAFHVKKQRDNHVQLFVYMYGTILEGRLRNLIVCLEDMLDMPDGVETVSETVFSRVEWHRIADRSLCGEFVMLAEQNAGTWFRLPFACTGNDAGFASGERRIRQVHAACGPATMAQTVVRIDPFV